MNIKELKGSLIKKELGAQRAFFRWHNKNKSGGNFGISIYDVNGRDWELSGDYNIEGTLRKLKFGYIFQAGVPVNVQNIEELFYFIKNIVEACTKRSS